MSDRRGQKYTKMWAIHENALMRSAIDLDTGSIFPMYGVRSSISESLMDGVSKMGLG